MFISHTNAHTWPTTAISAARASSEASRADIWTWLLAQQCVPICSDPAQAFSLPEAACAVAVDPLRDLVAALLCKLLDPRVPALPDGSQLLKALNVLMLKILDFSDRCALSMLCPSLPQYSSLAW